MARRKRSPKRKRPAGRPEPGWYGSLDADRKRRLLTASVRVLAGGLAVAAVVVGMWHLERRVHGQARFAFPPEIVLVDAPEGLDEIIRGQIALVSDRAWIEADLCERIARVLDGIVWVRQVERVRRLPSGRVEVRCRYRTPVAMVQDGREFVLLDAERVRLPGRYPYSPGWILLQGVQTPAPAAGQRWDAPDLVAAMEIAVRLADEPFAEQLTAVRVHNFGGRADALAAHVELATDRAGGRIIWGSALGREVEENAPEQKVALLRRNHELYGRVDAGRVVIDVSTFPDRFTTPAGG